MDFDKYPVDTVLYLHAIIDQNNTDSIKLFESIKNDVVDFTNKTATIYLGHITVKKDSTGERGLSLNTDSIEPFDVELPDIDALPTNDSTLCRVILKLNNIFLIH